MSSPLILTKIFKSLGILESVFIFLFPIALVTSITLTGIVLHVGVFIVLIVFVLSRLLNKKVDFLIFPSINTAFLIYIFAFAISKLFNSGLGSAFHMFCRTCEDYFVFLWVLYFVNKDSKNQNILKYSVLFAGILAISYGLLQEFDIDFLNRQRDIHRLSGFHRNSYSYGGQLIILFFFLLNEFFKRDFKKIYEFGFYILLSFSAFYCILNTSERAIILGVLIGLIFYLGCKHFYSPGCKKDKLFAVFLIIVLPVLFTLSFNIKVFKRIKRIFFPLDKSKANVRFKLWNIAISIWKRNILFGKGEFPKVVHQISEFKIQTLGHAHNIYLQILVLHGIVGLIAFLNLFLSLLKVLFVNIKNNEYALCLISIIFAFLIEGIFEYFWGDSEVRYFFLFFAGFVFSNMMTRSTKALSY